MAAKSKNLKEEYPLLFKKNEKALNKRYESAWDDIKKIAKMLKEKYGAEKVIVFGSLLNKKRFHKRSDIDLAVKGIDDELFYEAYGKIIGKYTDFKVDLVDIEDCKESLLKVINKEGKEI